MRQLCPHSGPEGFPAAFCGAGRLINTAERSRFMKTTITPAQISQTNLKLIYQYIYQRESVSQQDIAYALRLSRPTVSAKVNELEEHGLIRKAGQISSELAGRKAAAYSVVPDDP